MSIENIVFRKIEEISALSIHPRPIVPTNQLAHELSMSVDNLLRSLTELKQLRLVLFCDTQMSAIKLTLLGSVVKRDK